MAVEQKQFHHPWQSALRISRRTSTSVLRRERGVSLFVILLMVMLSMLLAIWASRAAYFNEMMVGNDADYRRAFEAAQALIQDAELDIEGMNSDGTACTPTAEASTVCRIDKAERIPADDQELASLIATLSGSDPNCRSALCARRVADSGTQNVKDFWDSHDDDAKAVFAKMTGSHSDGVSVGARFGQFTGARPGDDKNPANPLLREAREGKGGWYWIEVMPYATHPGSGVVVGGVNYLALNQKPNVAYRITAVVNGYKPHTRVVLQQTYVQQKFKN